MAKGYRRSGEMANAHGLEPCVARLEGSTPFSDTKFCSITARGGNWQT
jgi:hypothetical protein